MVSASNIKNNVTKTTIPSIYSYNLGFLLRKKVQSSQKKEAVDKHTTATDTLETLIDSKKKNQCTATRLPTKSSPKKSFFLIFVNSFLKAKKVNKVINAINILYQTNSMVFKEMSLPKIPVKPRINTIKWRDKSLCFAIILYTFIGKFVQK